MDQPRRTLETLPDELLLYILASYLTYFDLRRISRVSKRVKRMTEDIIIQRRLFQDPPNPSLKIKTSTKFSIHPIFQILDWNFVNEIANCVVGKTPISELPVFYEHAVSPSVYELCLHVTRETEVQSLLKVQSVTCRDGGEGVKVCEVLTAVSQAYNYGMRPFYDEDWGWRVCRRVEIYDEKVHLFVIVE